MRGKLGQNANGVPLIRITPAGTGKTDSDYFNLRGIEDHPRRCGENIHALLIVPKEYGSPPQVRGKHFDMLFTAL